MYMLLTTRLPHFSLDSPSHIIGIYRIHAQSLLHNFEGWSSIKISKEAERKCRTLETQTAHALSSYRFILPTRSKKNIPKTQHTQNTHAFQQLLNPFPGRLTHEINHWMATAPIQKWSGCRSWTRLPSVLMTGLQHLLSQGTIMRTTAPSSLNNTWRISWILEAQVTRNLPLPTHSIEEFQESMDDWKFFSTHPRSCINSSYTFNLLAPIKQQTSGLWVSKFQTSSKNWLRLLKTKSNIINTVRIR